MFRKILLQIVSEQRPKVVRKRTVQISWGRGLQVEKAAGTKAMSQECDWQIQGQQHDCSRLKRTRVTDNIGRLQEPKIN